MNKNMLNSIIGRTPWSVWKGFGSFLFFEFGQKRRNPDGNPKGEFTLWIEMAHWRIRVGPKEIAHSESPDKIISRKSALLQGRKLQEVRLSDHIRKNKVLRSAHFVFENQHVLDVFQYEKGTDVIFAINSKTEVLTYDYDGKLKTEKWK